VNEVAVWPEEVLERFLTPFSTQELRERLRDFSLTEEETRLTRLPEEALRSILIARAQADEDTRDWLAYLWREARRDVVARIDAQSPEELAADCRGWRGEMEAEELLLALLTDERVEGWARADEFVRALAGRPCRAEFKVLLARWRRAIQQEAGPAGRPLALPAGLRLVIVGGHPRDEGKLTPRLFAGRGAKVSWFASEHGQLGYAKVQQVQDCVLQADAVILVTDHAAHSLCAVAKRAADHHGILRRQVTSATEAQLRQALEEMGL